MQVEHRAVVNAAPEVIFRIYEDVALWHTWDPDTKQAVINGPFRAGAKGRLTPTQGRTVPMELTQVTPGKSFTAESKIPLLRMVFEHELNAGLKGTEVIHRVSFSGALSLVIGRMLARRVDAGLPVTLARLKTLAESGAAARAR